MKGIMFHCLLLISIFLVLGCEFVKEETPEKKHTIQFDSQGGSAVPSMDEVLHETKITEPSIPVRKGFLFRGWYLESSYTNRWDFSTYSVISDLVLYAKWTEIFSGPAGGYVFYDKGYYSDGWRYLESAPAFTERTGIWGSSSVHVQITKKEIGTGKYNTTEILRRYGYTGGNTARYCDNLVVTYGETTYDDWFLPSIDELNQIYQVLHQSNLGAFDDGYYWSSSEDSRFSALILNFQNGNTHNYTKGLTAKIRAIRAF